MTKCATCVFWGASDWGGDGRCRRYAPHGEVSVWPMTAADDWCGDWEGEGEIVLKIDDGGSADE
jgi:hypothetical protein